MFEELQEAMRDSQMKKLVADGIFKPPATITQLMADVLPITANRQKFAPGTALKCVRKPWGQRFPNVGDVVVCVSQDLALMAKDNEPGSNRTAPDMADTMVAIPKVSDTGWLIHQTHSSCFLAATPEEVAAADAQLTADAALVLEDAKAFVASRNADKN